METNTYQHQIDIKTCDLLRPQTLSVGSGMATSSDYPEFTLVYSYESYAGNGIYENWCPKEEALVSRLLAFASAVRWDVEVLTCYDR